MLPIILEVDQSKKLEGEYPTKYVFQKNDFVGKTIEPPRKWSQTRKNPIRSVKLGRAIENDLNWTRRETFNLMKSSGLKRVLLVLNIQMYFNVISKVLRKVCPFEPNFSIRS